MGNNLGGSGNMTPEERQQLLTSINEQIKSHRVVIYSKSYCPYCTQAKNVRKCLLFKKI